MTITVPTNPTVRDSAREPAPPSGALDITRGRDLHVVDLTVEYRRGDVAVVPVRNFNFYAGSGRVSALIGRSGSGKTSVLSCLAAMLRPLEGTVWLGGIEVSMLTGRQLDAYRRCHVGIVHQSYNLIPSLTSVENVAVPLRLAGVPRAEAIRRAADLLGELGLSRFERQRPGQLSGGQQQRVAFARAIAPRPSLVIADEPTAHLDGSSVADVRQMLRRIADDGRTVVIATHDDRLLSVADQVVHLG